MIKKLLYLIFFFFIITVITQAIIDNLYPFCLIRNTGLQDGQNLCCSGLKRWWHPSTLPVPITINRTGSRQAPGELTANAVRRAMATWNNVPSSFFEFFDAGLTDQNFHANDGINIVIFDVEGDNFAEGTTVLAFSRTITNTDHLGYRAIDSDMVFNARDYAWGTGSTANEFDIETVALHEFGHHLGLDHAGGHRDLDNANSGCGPVIGSAVMYYAVSQGSRKRILHPDDIAGLTQIYPNWTFEGYVNESTTGMPIVGVGVQLHGTACPQDTITRSVILSDDNGYFFAPVLNDSFSITVARFGYRASEKPIVQIPAGVTMPVDFTLEPLPLSSIKGVVRDSTTGKGISARVQLLVDDTIRITTMTDPGGAYLFADLPITDSITTNYQALSLEPVLPYPAVTSKEQIILLPGKVTELNFELSPARVFVVDDDGSDNYEVYYTAVLEKLGMSYVAWDVNIKGSATDGLNYFSAKPVIWFTGNRTENILSPVEITRLRAHLARGGSLFLSGQNIAEHLAARNSQFLTEVLHTAWVDNIRDPILHGVQNDPIGADLAAIAIGGGDGARNQNSTDRLLPTEPAIATVLYDTINVTVAGIRLEEAIPGVTGSRLVFFGFGLEGINDLVPGAGFATRQQVLANVLAWLTGQPTAVSSEFSNSQIVDRFALFPNFPNPFNNATIIRFWIPANESADKATLKIYDILGRVVRTLVNDTALRPGEHTVSWDGLDDSGRNVATGVYFYEFKMGTFNQIRKLLFVK